MQPEHQHPRYMIDEYYNIGRPIFPNRIHVIAETRHGRGIGLRPEVVAEAMADILRAYGIDIEDALSRDQPEDTIDYDII